MVIRPQALKVSHKLSFSLVETFSKQTMYSMISMLVASLRIASVLHLLPYSKGSQGGGDQ